MEHSRDEEAEAILGDIIANGRDEVASFLLDTVGQLEEQGEEEGYVHDGSGDTMEEQEGDRADCSGDRTKPDQVYIY